MCASPLLLRPLLQVGVHEIILAINYQPEVMMEYLADVEKTVRWQLEGVIHGLRLLRCGLCVRGARAIVWVQVCVVCLYCVIALRTRGYVSCCGTFRALPPCGLSLCLHQPPLPTLTFT